MAAAAAAARVHHPQVHHRVSARDTATMAAAEVRAHSHHHRAASAPAAVLSRTEDRRLRRSPLPVEQQHRLRRRGRAPGCGEVAGGTAAGCAAVSCCLPLAVVELVVLAAVRAPAALCQRSIRKRRRAAKRKETEDDLVVSATGDASPTSVAQAKNSALEADDDEAWPCWSLLKPAAVAAAAEELAEAEEEVWARFCGNGFWRSPEETW